MVFGTSHHCYSQWEFTGFIDNYHRLENSPKVFQCFKGTQEKLGGESRTRE
ncbi:hypothetical protein N665_0309s0035 [Sinapis alba]|nr:hypothetical protein N665_0309s0035 [Sinapis alba]